MTSLCSGSRQQAPERARAAVPHRRFGVDRRYRDGRTQPFYADVLWAPAVNDAAGGGDQPGTPVGQHLGDATFDDAPIQRRPAARRGPRGAPTA